VDNTDNAVSIGEAAFRRDAAHALSTPLGSLLLQAELIDHYLGSGKVGQARDAVGTLLRDFETFGQRFRSVFSAMADIAEDGTSEGDPRACLAEALVELGEETVHVGYRGVSPRVAVPAHALTALMRRLAMLATTLGGGQVTLIAAKAEEECLLSLTAAETGEAGDAESSFDSPRSLHFRVALEIAARHGGRLKSGTAPGAIALLTLPLAREPA
jgi:hypothetical protein